jgi:hypothetical protein
MSVKGALQDRSYVRRGKEVEERRSAKEQAADR